jgi:hypothetical protein
MSQYRKKPVVIEATQWFKHGDHPSVVLHTNQSGGVIKGEGPYGWVQTLEGGHIVTTGDWIITGVKGEHYPCKPDIFAMTYEAAAPALQGEPSELSDAEICQLADRHLRGTGPHCIINFARALLSRRTVPDAAPDQDKRDAIDDVPVAWMTDETPPRVCSDYSKNSSMARTTQASYCIPLYRKAANE